MCRKSLHYKNIFRTGGGKGLMGSAPVYIECEPTKILSRPTLGPLEGACS